MKVFNVKLFRGNHEFTVFILGTNKHDVEKFLLDLDNDYEHFCIVKPYPFEATESGIKAIIKSRLKL